MKRAVVLGLAALVFMGFWWWWHRAPRPTSEPVAPTAESGPVDVVEQDGLTLVGGTGFELHYLAADGNAQEDLQAISELWDAAMLLVKDFDRFPLADNVDFTAFLQGGNPHRVAWIRPRHPAVSGQGELLDRWAVPVFFHKESSRRITLRSAGPDRTMWTDDDVVMPK